MASRRRKPPPRWSRPAAEAAAVMTALALAFAAGAAGFVVGRETAEDDAPAAAETSQTTTEATTAETETTATETQTTPTDTGGGTTTGNDDDQEADGEAVFASAGCGSCHTFEPAGTSGTIGPNLGETDLNEDEIAAVVENGRGAMPSFQGQLSDAEIAAVADYVAGG